MAFMEKANLCGGNLCKGWQTFLPGIVGNLASYKVVVSISNFVLLNLSAKFSSNFLIFGSTCGGQSEKSASLMENCLSDRPPLLGALLCCLF
jgi:hypothetical protein